MSVKWPWHTSRTLYRWILVGLEFGVEVDFEVGVAVGFEVYSIIRFGLSMLSGSTYSSGRLSG